MFRLIGETLYVATPTQQKAVRLVRLIHEKKLGTAYLVAITCIFLVCFLGGLTVFVLLLIFTQMTPARLALGTTTTLAGLGAGLAFTKAGYAIAHDNQVAQMQRFVRKGLILQIPQVCSDELLLQLERLECLPFLSYYRPDPYDFGDLTKLVDEFGQGSSSQAFITTRVVPAMQLLAWKIYTAMRKQEEGHFSEADALGELPRPNDSEGC